MINIMCSRHAADIIIIMMKDVDKDQADRIFRSFGSDTDYTDS